MRADVVVVGAGPSGACAAYHLALAGHDVLLVDKNTFPRPKACGDGLTPRALAALDRMGLRRLWLRCLRIDGIRVVDRRNGTEAVFGFGEGGGPRFGGALPRFDLDNELLLWAAKAGARISTETAAVELKHKRNGIVVHLNGASGPWQCEARFAVVADGAAGRLSQAVLRRPRGSSMELFALRQYFHTSVDIGPYFEIHAPLMNNGAPIAGYTWIFPVSSGIVNVGSGFARTVKSGGNLRRMHEKGVQVLKERGSLCGAECGPAVGAPLPVALAPANSIGQGWLVIGDAAGVVNPFTGEGIAQALESGEMAFQAIDAALRMCRKAATDYPRLLEDHFRRRLRLGSTIPELLGVLLTSEWTDALSGGHGRAAGRAIRNILLDSSSPARSELWNELTRDISMPALWGAFDQVGSRLSNELNEVSPVFAEAAAAGRTDEGMCGYGSALVLAVAISCGRVEEEHLLLAELVELVTLQAHFQDTVPATLGVSRVSTSFNILLGDAIIARLFAVLNGFELCKANEIASWMQAHADGVAASAILAAPPLRHSPPASLIASAAGMVAVSHAPAARPAVEVWAHVAVEALQAVLRYRDSGDSVDGLEAARRRLHFAHEAIGAVGLTSDEPLHLLTRNLEETIRNASGRRGEHAIASHSATNRP